MRNRFLALASILAVAANGPAYASQKFDFSLAPTNGSTLSGSGWVYVSEAAPQSGSVDLLNSYFTDDGQHLGDYGLVAIGDFFGYQTESSSSLTSFSAEFSNYMLVGISAIGTLNDTPGYVGSIGVTGAHYTYSQQRDDGSTPPGPVEVSSGDVVFASSVPEPASGWLLLGALPLLVVARKRMGAR